MWTQPITADTVRLTVAVDNLASLPSGASYTAQQGRAKVKAWTEPQKGDALHPTIIIEATCDSLQQLCYQYMHRGDSLEEQVVQMQRQMSESASNTNQTAIEGCKIKMLNVIVMAIACAICGLIYLFLNIKKNK